MSYSIVLLYIFLNVSMVCVKITSSNLYLTIQRCSSGENFIVFQLLPFLYHELRLHLTQPCSQRETEREWRLISCWRWGIKTIFFELWAKKMPPGCDYFLCPVQCLGLPWGAELADWWPFGVSILEMCFIWPIRWFQKWFSFKNGKISQSQHPHF